jgi:N-acetylornithine carbamoyltransferase
MSLRHLRTCPEISDADWEALVRRALWHHANPGWRETARGKSLGLVFFNPSLRTRTSMEVAAAQLGAFTTVLTPGTGTWDLEWRDGVRMDGAAAEHVREAIGVLSQYVDALGVRVFAALGEYAQDRDEAVLRAIQDAATVPVINLESAFYHPCQALADAAALRAHHGPAGGRRFVLAWATHPKPLPMAVPNSALLMAAREGHDVVVARPPEYALDAGVMETAHAFAAASGGSVSETDNLDAACDGADVVYAKAWGGPLAYSDPAGEAELRTAAYAGWRITDRHVASGAFMHCLPVRRGVVVDGSVLDGPRSIHLLQAGFRLHAAKAVLEGVLDGVEEWKKGGREG